MRGFTTFVDGRPRPGRSESNSLAVPPRVGGEAGKRVVMRSPCAGTALDPPLWTIVPNKALSLSLSLSLSESESLHFKVTMTG
jgi:hypothetical protein